MEKPKMRVMNVYDNVSLKSLTNQQTTVQDVRDMCLALSLHFLDNPLVIDSSLIEHNQQVVLHIQDKSDSAVMGLHSSIWIQHVSGLEYSCLKQRALKLGQKVKLLHGNNCVRDKMTPSDVCAKFGLPFRFDGPMHAFGMYIDLYTSKHSDPIHYKGT